MNRRGFLQGILAAGVAPAVVKAGILMPVKQVQVATLPEIVALSEASLEEAMKEICSSPTRYGFASTLWPGIKAFWGKAYDEHARDLYDPSR